MHNNPQKVAKTFLEILKYNDRHDPKTGRFAPKNGGVSGAGSDDDFDPYALLMAAAAEADANPVTQVPDPEPQNQMPKSKLTEATMAKCKEVERASLGMRNEQMTVIDGNGNIVVQKEGEPDGVDFTIGDLHKMENRVITHNHPQEFGGTFSPKDISTFQAGNAKAIRIVANEGTYHLEGGDATYKQRHNFEQQARARYESAMGDWAYSKRQLDADVRAGTLKREDAERMKNEFRTDTLRGLSSAYEELALEHGLIYTFAPSGDVKKFNPYHDKLGRFTSANGAGAAAASSAWSKKMDEEQEVILAKSVSKQAMFLHDSGMLDYDAAVEAMRNKTTEGHIRNYFAIMKANGDPTSTKPLSDNKARRNSDVDSGKYKDHDEAKKGYIKEKTGVDEEEAAKISKEITKWTSNSWDDADTATIDSYIEKDHTYNGEIYRGMHFDAEGFDSFMANMQPGSTIGMKRNSSWSSDEADARTFSHVIDDNVNSVMIRCVKNRSASPIAYLNSQGEREVVAHSQTKWTVLNVQTAERGTGAKKAWITVVEKGDYE